MINLITNILLILKDEKNPESRYRRVIELLLKSTSDLNTLTITNSPEQRKDTCKFLINLLLFDFDKVLNRYVLVDIVKTISIHLSKIEGYYNFLVDVLDEAEEKLPILKTDNLKFTIYTFFSSLLDGSCTEFGNQKQLLGRILSSIRNKIANSIESNDICLTILTALIKISKMIIFSQEDSLLLSQSCFHILEQQKKSAFVYQKSFKLIKNILKNALEKKYSSIIVEIENLLKSVF